MKIQYVQWFWGKNLSSENELDYQWIPFSNKLNDVIEKNHRDRNMQFEVKMCQNIYSFNLQGEYIINITAEKTTPIIIRRKMFEQEEQQANTFKCIPLQLLNDKEAYSTKFIKTTLKELLEYHSEAQLFTKQIILKKSLMERIKALQPLTCFADLKSQLYREFDSISHFLSDCSYCEINTILNNLNDGGELSQDILNLYDRVRFIDCNVVRYMNLRDKWLDKLTLFNVLLNAVIVLTEQDESNQASAFKICKIQNFDFLNKNFTGNVAFYGNNILPLFMNKKDNLKTCQNSNGITCEMEFILKNAQFKDLNGRLLLPDNSLFIMKKFLKRNGIYKITFQVSQVNLLKNESLKYNDKEQILLSGGLTNKKDFDTFCQLIKFNKKLNTLDVANNNLNDAKLLQLLKSLKHNNSLQNLYLTGNNLTQDGAKHLAEFIKHSKSLKKIDLAANLIGNTGMVYLSKNLIFNKVLQRLDLYFIDINENGFISLSDALKLNKTLKWLFIGENKIGLTGSNEFSEMLKVNNSLERLNLYNTGIGDKEIEHLATGFKSNTSLTAINLRSNKITDKGVEVLAVALSQSSSIREVFMANNKFTDIGAQLLLKVLEVNPDIFKIGVVNSVNGD
jgi:hypothetical protein